jgi:hypothetical protein
VPNCSQSPILETRSNRVIRRTALSWCCSLCWSRAWGDAEVEHRGNLKVVEPDVAQVNVLYPMGTMLLNALMLRMESIMSGTPSAARTCWRWHLPTAGRPTASSSIARSARTIPLLEGESYDSVFSLVFWNIGSGFQFFKKLRFYIY